MEQILLPLIVAYCIASIFIQWNLASNFIKMRRAIHKQNVKIQEITKKLNEYYPY